MGMLQRVPVRPMRGGLKEARGAPLEEHAYPYDVLMVMLQRAPVRPLRGGLKRRAVRRLEEHTYAVRRADRHAAARAGAPFVGWLGEARGASLRKATFRPTCDGRAAARAGAPSVGLLEEARGAPFRIARVIRTTC